MKIITKFLLSAILVCTCSVLNVRDAAAADPILAENFSGGVFPNGWTTLSSGPVASDFSVTAPGSGSNPAGMGSIQIPVKMSYMAATYAWLITPELSIPADGSNPISFSFLMNLPGVDAAEVNSKLKLKVRVGANETPLTYDVKTSNYERWLSGSVSLDAYKGETIQLMLGREVGAMDFMNGFINSQVTDIWVGEVVSATGIEISASRQKIIVGKTYQLTATVIPADATNKDVTWKSSNTEVATVSDGKVTAVSIGTATITATTVDGEFNATCEIEVTPEPLKLPFEEKFVNTLMPQGWTTLSSGPVASDFSITGPGSGSNPAGMGSIQIPVKMSYMAATYAWLITPELSIPADASNPISFSFLMNLPGVDAAEVNSKLKLKVRVGANETPLTYDVNTSNYERWLSGSVSLDAYKGETIQLMLGREVGAMDFTNGFINSQVTDIWVGEAVSATGIEISASKQKIILGKTHQLTANVIPADATNKNVTWKSSNTAVATVSYGKVTAAGLGKATITATTLDGEFTATCEIEVTPVPLKLPFEEKFAATSMPKGWAIEGDRSFSFDGNNWNLTLSDLGVNDLGTFRFDWGTGDKYPREAWLITPDLEIPNNDLWTVDFSFLVDFGRYATAEEASKMFQIKVRDADGNETPLTFEMEESSYKREKGGNLSGLFYKCTTSLAEFKGKNIKLILGNKLADNTAPRPTCSFTHFLVEEVYIQVPRDLPFEEKFVATSIPDGWSIEGDRSFAFDGDTWNMTLPGLGVTDLGTFRFNWGMGFDYPRAAWLVTPEIVLPDQESKSIEFSFLVDFGSYSTAKEANELFQILVREADGTETPVTFDMAESAYKLERGGYLYGLFYKCTAFLDEFKGKTIKLVLGRELANNTAARPTCDFTHFLVKEIDTPIPPRELPFEEKFVATSIPDGWSIEGDRSFAFDGDTWNMTLPGLGVTDLGTFRFNWGMGFDYPRAAWLVTPEIVLPDQESKSIEFSFLVDFGSYSTAKEANELFQILVREADGTETPVTFDMAESAYKLERGGYLYGLFYRCTASLDEFKGKTIKLVLGRELANNTAARPTCDFTHFLVEEKEGTATRIIYADVNVYTENNALCIDSPVGEIVTVYAVSGQRLIVKEKAAGRINISLPHSSSRVLIVKGSSGWVKKVIYTDGVN